MDTSELYNNNNIVKFSVVSINSNMCRLLITSSSSNLLTTRDYNGYSPVDHALKGPSKRYVTKYRFKGHPATVRRLIQNIDCVTKYTQCTLFDSASMV